MATDKRDECGCHGECVTTPHPCTWPCSWPGCLSEEEHAELLRELEDDCG